MCRWLAYSGSPLRIADLLYTPEHSLIDQSLRSDLGAETTNGDGFGIGWYGVDERSPDSHAAEEERGASERARQLAESGAAYAEDEEMREAEGDLPDARPEDVH